MKVMLLMNVITVSAVALMLWANYAAQAAEHKPSAVKKAIFGAGCFWEVEDAFARVAGVVATRVGYAGGTVPHPSYEQVCSGRTGHTEVVEVSYDPDKVSYAHLLQVFFKLHDPTEQQKTQYRSVIFYLNEEQHQAALAALANLPKSPRALTAVEEAGPFYEAEEYHQHYLQKHHLKSCSTNAAPSADTGASACALPGQPASAHASNATTVHIFTVADGKTTEMPVVKKSEEAWRAQLTAEQFHILREGGTEPAFNNAFWDNHAAGLYRCAACGTDLFASNAKFDSGSGWPSFTAPVSPLNLTEVVDRSYGMERTEVRCARCGGHLGHVFHDGPLPSGMRYCIDSGALVFVPAK